MTRAEQAEDLYTRVRACDLCPLVRTRTLAVPGEGPLEAEIMFIGEAPGMNEDRQGRPFVGAAGNFLSELLGHAGLKREDVYICNVLKCRPPNNRDPFPGEIEACADYLDEQIGLVDPLVIVTLGRFSMGRWFPNQTIGRIHGTVREADGRFIVPMYHPAAALHQAALKNTIIEDFRRLPGLIERARLKREEGEGKRELRLTPGVSSPESLPQATKPERKTNGEDGGWRRDLRLTHGNAAGAPDPETSSESADSRPVVADSAVVAESQAPVTAQTAEKATQDQAPAPAPATSSPIRIDATSGPLTQMRLFE